MLQHIGSHLSDLGFFVVDEDFEEVFLIFLKLFFRYENPLFNHFSHGVLVTEGDTKDQLGQLVQPLRLPTISDQLEYQMVKYLEHGSSCIFSFSDIIDYAFEQVCRGGVKCGRENLLLDQELLIVEKNAYTLLHWNHRVEHCLIN